MKNIFMAILFSSISFLISCSHTPRNPQGNEVGNRGNNFNNIGAQNVEVILNNYTDAKEKFDNLVKTVGQNKNFKVSYEAGGWFQKSYGENECVSGTSSVADAAFKNAWAEAQALCISQKLSTCEKVGVTYAYRFYNMPRCRPQLQCKECRLTLLQRLNFTQEPVVQMGI